MLKTNSKEVKERVRQHILDAVIYDEFETPDKRFSLVLSVK